MFFANSLKVVENLFRFFINDILCCFFAEPILMYLSAKNDPSDPSLAVVMYDIEMQHYINKELIELISAEAAAPILKKVFIYTNSICFQKKKIKTLLGHH